jgi:hypothetical protein
MKRLLSALAAVVWLSGSGSVLASSHGSSHGSSHSSHTSKSSKSSKSSKTTKSKGSSSGKTVHVKGYTKKDGTQVDAYDRKAPKSKGASTTTATTSPTTRAEHGCAACERDKNGRIKRSPKARADFMHRTGYPHGHHGYVVDHVIPLECGGADDPSNMQWQTVEEAKAKDATEHACQR